jgi:excisionase family DNA binding protein
MERSRTAHDADPDFATIRRAARLLGVPEGAIRRATRSGELPLYRPEKSWPLVGLADVRVWIASRRVSPPARGESAA